MSETWYPIIDFEKCVGCLICVNFCRKGVYAEQDGKPVVIKPVGCVHGCRGCQNKCPAGAIGYSGSEEGTGCSCGANCNPSV